VLVLKRLMTSSVTWTRLLPKLKREILFQIVG
jgi:hypothetical protein